MRRLRVWVTGVWFTGVLFKGVASAAWAATGASASAGAAMGVTSPTWEFSAGNGVVPPYATEAEALSASSSILSGRKPDQWSWSVTTTGACM